MNKTKFPSHRTMPFNPIFNKGAAVLKSIFNAVGVAAFAAAMFALPAWSQAVGTGRVNTEYDVVPSVDGGNGYLRYFYAPHPLIMTYVGNDGLISVCSVDTTSKITYIYEYSSDLQTVKTLHFNNEYEKIGSFAKDNEGNYYIFYAEDVQEEEFSRKNMALVKYNSEGVKIDSFYLEAQTSDEIWQSGYSGVKEPFSGGTSRMEISGNMLAVYFSRILFMAPDGYNHQASYGFILDKNSLERMPNMNTGMVSHSFNQYILPIENGFVFADLKEGGTEPEQRRFVFNRMLGKYNKPFELSFTFKMGPTWENMNQTFAQMGGLAKTSSGYIFAGTYEKNTIVNDPNHNDSRNLFITTFDNDLTLDSGPLWITNYDDIEKNAANPKIVSLGRDFLLMWEYMSSKDHLGTYMRIIDENGNPVSEEIELPNVRLNINDVLRYNKATSNVHWAVNNGSREIIVYSLDMQNWATPPSSSSTEPSSSSEDPSSSSEDPSSSSTEPSSSSEEPSSSSTEPSSSSEDPSSSSAEPSSSSADPSSSSEDPPSSSSEEPPSSSSEGEISSSSEDSTPIAHVPPAIASETSTYYNIKGEPMGSAKPAKPAKPGVYLVKQGNSIRKIVVR
jgi:hypothetical protein